MLTTFFPLHHAKYGLLNLVGNEVSLKGFKQRNDILWAVSEEN